MAKIIKKKSVSSVEWKLPFDSHNYKILLAGLVTIFIGYLLMWTGVSESAASIDGTWNNFMAINAAPVVLIIGYCVIIPLGIMKFFGKEETAEQQ